MIFFFVYRQRVFTYLPTVRKFDLYVNFFQVYWRIPLLQDKVIPRVIKEKDFSAERNISTEKTTKKMITFILYK